MRPLFMGFLAVVVTLPVAAATLQLPGTVTREASGPAGATVTFVATANGTGLADDFNGRPANGAPPVTCTPASGSMFPLGTTTVTCSATDPEGTATGTFDVVVTDTTGPVLNLPAAVSVQASSPNGANVSYDVSANDAVDGARPVTCSPGPGLFPVGATIVTCSASDSRGNQSTGSFTVTVGPEPPTHPPTLKLPADITAEATSAAGAAVTYSASSSADGPDDFNGRPTDQSSAVCVPSSGSTFPLGLTPVQCTATSSGGTVNGSFNVTVVDTTGPDLRIPRAVTVTASSNDGAAVSYAASAVDVVDGSVAVSCAPASGDLFVVGTTAVTCSASDSRGNGSTGSFDVVVLPPGTPPPVINVPSDITVEAAGPDGSIVSYTVTTNGAGGLGDDENGRPLGNGATCTPSSGSVFSLGTTTVQCTAGSSSATFLVHVVDTTAPVLSLPDDITTSQAVVTFAATATDLVSGTVPVTCNPASGSTFAQGATTVNCTATDGAGNGASGSFTVTVTDSAPVRTIAITASPDKLWPPDKKFVPVTITVTMSDGSPFSAQIVGVHSSESDPNDRTSPDWVITGPLTLDLRAEKSEQAQLRVYTIDVEIVDDANLHSLRSVNVTVTNPDAASATSQVTAMRKKRG